MNDIRATSCTGTELFSLHKTARSKVKWPFDMELSQFIEMSAEWQCRNQEQHVTSYRGYCAIIVLSIDSVLSAVKYLGQQHIQN